MCGLDIVTVGKGGAVGEDGGEDKDGEGED